MPTFEFTSPEGVKHRVTGPEGATPEQAFQILQGATPIESPAASAPSGHQDGRAKNTFGDDAQFIAQNLGGKGLARILGLPVDTMINAGDLITAIGGTADRALTGRVPPDLIDRAKQFGSSEQIENWMRKVGLIDTRGDATSPEGRILGAGLQAMPSILAGGRASPGQAAKSAATAAVGGAGAQGTAEAGGGPEARVIASALPGARRQAGAPSVAEVIRQKVTAGKDVAGAVRDSREAGVQPSAGAVTGSKTIQGIEGTLSKLPGASGTMDRAAEARAAGMGGRIKEIQQTLASAGTSRTTAGQAIQSGAAGKYERIHDTIEELYKPVDKLIDPNTPVPVAQTRAGLDKLSAKGKGALAQTLVEPDVKKWREALEADLKDGKQLSYQDVQGLRQIIGKKLGAPGMMEDARRPDLERLYATLSEDIRKANISPEARTALDRAQQYTRAGHTRIREVLKPLADKKTPEQAYAYTVQGTEQGATKLRRIMGGLKPAERREVSAQVVEELGTVSKGQRDDQGGGFSVDQFLTKWNGIHDDAKKVLFPDPKTRADLDQVAKVANDLKSAGKAVYNPSGTGKAAAHIGMASAGASALTALFTGHPGIAAAVVGGAGVEMATSHAMARAMNSPEFIRWLAEGSKAPPDRTAAYAARLAVIARNSKDPEDKQALEYLADKLKAIQ